MMRKLTIALACCGSTFGLTPPSTIVTAVVVLIRAFVVGDAPRRLSRRRPSRSEFRRAKAIGAGSTGASASKNGFWTANRAGIGLASSAAMAAAILPTAVERGGIEEWPPASSATISTLRYPFSPIPSSATGFLHPRQHVEGDRPSLVQHEVETHAALGQQGGHGLGSLASPDLLVVADGEIDGPRGIEPLGEQGLDPFEEADDGALVVDGAPPPQVAVRRGRPRTGACSQASSVPGSTGTTSMWAISRIGAAVGSAPSQV